jgi:hypothetical protein
VSAAGAAAPSAAFGAVAPGALALALSPDDVSFPLQPAAHAATIMPIHQIFISSSFAFCQDGPV